MILFTKLNISLSWERRCSWCLQLVIFIFLLLFRSSRPKVFCKRGVLKNFANFTGRHLCQNLFLNKIAGLRPATLLKKRLWHRCFPVNFLKFLKNTFSYRTPPVAASDYSLNVEHWTKPQLLSHVNKILFYKLIQIEESCKNISLVSFWFIWKLKNERLE